MVDRAEQLISEIRQIKAQYVKEVGRGRRAWPQAIKGRIAELERAVDAYVRLATVAIEGA